MNIEDFYRITSDHKRQVLVKLQTRRMRNMYKIMVHYIFSIENDQKLHAITIMASDYQANFKLVLDLLMKLDDELEDYMEPIVKNKVDKEAREVLVAKLLPHNIKIYNTLSLGNVKTLSIRCPICLGKN